MSSTSDESESASSSSSRASSPQRGRQDDPTWAYQPPEGAQLFDHGQADSGEFDWDAVNDDANLELVLIRVPPNIQTKDLDGVKLQTTKEKGGKVGSFTASNADYDVWSLGGSNVPVGGEEMKGLRCLLPRRKKGGKLYLAPKIALDNNLVVTLKSTESDNAASVDTARPPRFSYPEERLNGRFIPYGSQTGGPPKEPGHAMEVSDSQSVPKKKRHIDETGTDIPRTPKKRKKEGQAKKV
ncbi:hypothetical protein SISSUDRAFT_87909 [Sistotremastrum suecicum HHB10207 ss-3]|uniref:Uncharacterized protein n=1 Tax=Sistotremastrum suecicum HHB10207 ss-3 TaxID=1314776 RepID=A0A166BBV1_9AGAM|nr:hypothetical protein SISSUDRAFT_87909 [Sistotremastrum suecicum HHB10207 ss-3]